MSLRRTGLLHSQDHLQAFHVFRGAIPSSAFALYEYLLDSEALIVIC